MKILKNLVICSCFLLMLFSTILLVGCKDQSNSNSNSNSNSQIEISFTTEKGSLSFYSKTLNGNTLSISDCPTVTYNGDDYIFDFWANENNQKFNFDSTIESNITLHAHFEEAEYVCFDTWQKDKSLVQYKGTTFSEVVVSARSSSAGTGYFKTKTIGKKLMAKSKILSEYVTLREFNSLSNKNVFTTTANEPTILKASDLTNNVYTVATVLAFSDYSYISYDYAPAGKQPAYAIFDCSTILSTYISRKVNISKFNGGGGSQGIRMKEFGQKYIYQSDDGLLSYSQFNHETISTYSTDFDDFDYQKDDTYFIFTQIKDYYESYSYYEDSGLSTDEKYYSYTTSDGKDSYTQYFYFDSTGRLYLALSTEEFYDMRNA